MKKVTKIIILLSIALLISACNDNKGSFDSGINKVSIAECNTSTSTSILSGDLLVKEDTGTIVEIVHDANGSKRICTQSGQAHLIRGN